VPGFVNFKKGCTRLTVASDKVYQLLTHGRWFSPGTPTSSTTKTGRHDIAEILLKVALNTMNQIKSNQIFYCSAKKGKFVTVFITFVGHQFICFQSTYKNQGLILMPKDSKQRSKVLQKGFEVCAGINKAIIKKVRVCCKPTSCS
jgi:hypothetical protein